MLIIPVIDLLDGHAVLAKSGNRSQYAPLNTPLCASFNPIHVARALLSVTSCCVCPSVLYIADLNSILQRDNNLSYISEIAQQFPKTTIWLDAGEQTSQTMELYLSYKNIRPILGSESYVSLDKLMDQLKQLKQYSPLLSLDFRNQILLGPDTLLEHSQYWPNDVIILSLDQVGNKTGGNVEFASSIKSKQVNRSYYVGGGIRTVEDIVDLEKSDFQGILVASSLHDKTLTEKELSRF